MTAPPAHMPSRKKKGRAREQREQQEQREQREQREAEEWRDGDGPQAEGAMRAAIESFVASDRGEASRAAYYEETNARLRAAGLDELSGPPGTAFVSQRPKPQCDVCGAERAKQKCSRCQSAHYCSQACQLAHWKRGGHKAACAGLQEELRGVAAAVAAQMRELGGSGESGGAPSSSRESEALMAPVRDLDRLDAEGAYLLAVEEFGLHEALLALLRADAAAASTRWARGLCCSWLEHATSALFRGQRRSRAGHASFGKADGGRCAAFALSDADAWPTWLDAAAATAALLTSCAVGGGRRGGGGNATTTVGLAAHRTARNVWNFLSMALACKECGRAVVLFRQPASAAAGEGDGGGGGGGSGGGTAGTTATVAAASEAEAARRDFLRWRGAATAATMRSAMEQIAGATETQDPNSAVEANVNQVAAMLAHWYGLLLGPAAGARFTAALGLRGARKQMYEQMAVPFAVGSIAKGRMLTGEEAHQLMIQAM